MREILLTKGKVAIVDDEDFEEVNKHKWYCMPHRNTFYACRHGGNYSIINMSHQIMGNVDGKVIDHINRNGLDNRRCNLRFCSVSENCRNKKLNSNNTSGFRGVHWDLKCKKWVVQVQSNYTVVYRALFDDKVEAAMDYDRKARELFGDFVVLNFPSKE